jgi:regulator of sirC expression with transglutaminase-like and TPR domain
MSAAPDKEERHGPSFERLAREPDETLDLALGAALIAKDTYDAIDVLDVVAELDRLAGPLAGAGLESVGAPAQVAAVTARFRELGFRGNTDDFYDPKNSFLPDVLERRTGIPISLTVVWCALAKCAGVTARGVAFPGHVIARVEDTEAGAPILVDPFGGGRVLDERDLDQLLRRALGDGAELHRSLVAPASNRALLVRMLSNLKAIWASRGDHARAFVAIDRIVTLVPDSPRDLRERAAIALRLGATELARIDLARVLELEPQAPDVPHLKERLARLGGAAPKKPTILH